MLLLQHDPRTEPHPGDRLELDGSAYRIVTVLAHDEILVEKERGEAGTYALQWFDYQHFVDHFKQAEPILEEPGDLPRTRPDSGNDPIVREFYTDTKGGE